MTNGATGVANRRIGRIDVDPLGCSLSCNGTIAKLSPRAMNVLTYFIDHRQRTVTHEELLDAFWRGAISSTNAVHKCVSELRHALADLGDDQVRIETVPKRGYRLVAPIEQLDAANGFPQSENGTTTIRPNDEALSANGAQRAVERPHWTQTRRMLVSLAALVGLVVAGVVLTQRSGFFLEHGARSRQPRERLLYFDSATLIRTPTTHSLPREFPMHF